MSIHTDHLSTSDGDPGRSAAVSALRGVAAAAVGVGVGELVASATDAWPSPVIGIGNAVVDLVPEPVKSLAIDLFGTADKIALLVGIGVLLLVFAAVIGLVARRNRPIALGLTALFGVVGAVAALADPALGLGAVVPSLVGGAAAVGVLAWLTRPTTQAAGPEGRRVLLRDLGIAGVGAAVTGTAGRFIANATAVDVEAQRDSLALPEPTEPVSFPAAADIDVDGVVPFRTPNEDFYRIDTQLSVPRLSRDGWTLKVTGMVDEPLELTLDELEDRFEVIERGITMSCVSNEVGGDLVGNATWRGVRVADVLDAAGVQDGADQLVGRAFDDFTVGYPVANAFDRDAMLAVGMNGEPLPAAHGFPLRMVVPGLYGYVSATKWLTELELTTFDAFDQYWVERGWDQQAPIKTQSRIDTPKGLQTVERGTVPVAGVAWAQTRGIEKVEVQIDDGDWQEAELAAAFNDVTWRQWVFRWDTTGVEAGRHRLRVRATDATGETQTEDRTEPFPNGASGWHQVIMQVAEA